MSLCENSSNVNLAAGLIAASWQSSQRQSVVDGVEYREKLLKEEKKSVEEGEKKGYLLWPFYDCKALLYCPCRLYSLVLSLCLLLWSPSLPRLCDLTLVICVNGSGETLLWFYPRVMSFF